MSTAEKRVFGIDYECIDSELAAEELAAEQASTKPARIRPNYIGDEWIGFRVEIFNKYTCQYEAVGVNFSEYKKAMLSLRAIETGNSPVQGIVTDDRIYSTRAHHRQHGSNRLWIFGRCLAVVGILIILGVLLVLDGCALSPPERKWDSKDTLNEAVYQISNAWDAVQTNEFQYRDDVEEGGFNKIFLGAEPTTRDIIILHTTLAVSHAAISYFLPEKWRRWWQGITGVAASANAIRNCAKFDAGC